MSAVALQWAWQADVGPEQKLILLAIADVASKAGVAPNYPEDLIKRRTRLKLWKLREAVADLEETGLLIVLRPVNQHPCWQLSLR